MSSTPTHIAPATLSTIVLIEEVRREMQCFHHGQSTGGDVYALELMRRALVERDEAAWAGMYTLYERIVGSWILQIACFPEEEITALVNEVFARFACSIPPHKFAHFSGSAPALLVYLHSCARSVTLNALDLKRRSEQKKHMESLERLALTHGTEPLDERDPADVVAEDDADEHARQMVMTQAHSVAERVVLHALAASITPHELQEQYPTIFPRIEDIYRVKHTVLARLRRNEHLHTELHSALTPDYYVARLREARSELGRVLEAHIQRLVQQTDSLVCNGIHYYRRPALCGLSRCRKCRDGIGHGPYWYASKRVNSRMVSVYLGRNLIPVSWEGEKPSFRRESKRVPTQPKEPTITIHSQLSFCGRSHCRTCREGKGHGPYWYAYQVVNGRTVRTYLGRVSQPAGEQDEGQALKRSIPER